MKLFSYFGYATKTNDLLSGDLKIYPNPANDILNIKLPTNEKATGKIISINGRTVLNFECVDECSLSIKDIDSGLYFLELATAGNFYTSKLIISR